MELSVVLAMVVAEIAILTGGYIDADSPKPVRAIAIGRVLFGLIPMIAAVFLIPDPTWKVAAVALTPVLVKAGDAMLRSWDREPH
ncbi:hypothetical protein D5S17_09170 [Pseudonocardiaceae bacterium YIM PH 21723]|nr:hypothetical protein D5S17_09170 [Pseudonocardiaceae bacterium YIM PH 21723]